MLRLCLVSHGEELADVWDSSGSPSLPGDIPLSRKGRNQASELAVRIKSVLPERCRYTVYTSPYLSSLQTAQIIDDTLSGNTTHKLSIASVHGNRNLVPIPEIRQQDYGNTPEDNMDKTSRMLRARLKKFYYRYPTGESGADVYNRVNHWLHMTLAENRGTSSLVIVTHRLPIMMILMSLYHWSPDTLVSMESIRKGGLYCLNYYHRNRIEFFRSDPLYRYISVRVSFGSHDYTLAETPNTLHLKLRDTICDPSHIRISRSKLRKLLEQQHPELKRNWIKDIRILRPHTL